MTDTVTTTRTTTDVRGYWRVLLAAIAPLPMLAQAVYYLLIPVDGDATFADEVDALRAHEGLATTLTLLNCVFVVALVPAIFAVAWVCRRGAPRLTTWGATIALLGSLAGFTLLGGPFTAATMTVTHDLDPAGMAAFADALESEPVLAVAGLLFILGIVVGLGLLGVAMWRSKVAPTWMGVALLVGGVTHPFLPGHTAQGVGLVLAAAGFAGATRALLRWRNDDFDLPPLSVA